MKKFSIILIVTVAIVVLAILKLRAQPNNPDVSPTPQIPDGITKEEHESHHPELNNNQ
mgnify:CR=1 FL=1